MQNLCYIITAVPPWWNWQTRRTQNPVVVIPCRFDSDRRHQQNGGQFLPAVLFILEKQDENESDGAKRRENDGKTTSEFCRFNFY